jgi:hypothetical protein
LNIGQKSLTYLYKDDCIGMKNVLRSPITIFIQK